MMTATTRKMSFEKKHLRSCDYFAVIPSCWHSTAMLAKYTQTGLVCAPIQRLNICGRMLKLSSKP